MPIYGRRYPIGAEPVMGGGVHFRVWAPTAESVAVQISPKLSFAQGGLTRVSLEPEAHGYFSGFSGAPRPGMFYRFELGADSAFPDPASRFQPAGPHGPSEIIAADQFRWTDQNWRGVAAVSQVIYEMHIGTLTPEGTWTAAARELPALADLGVTIVEVMPVAEFPGTYGWGYDGVDLFAPTRLYGRPDDFRYFVDQAHAHGLAVILDVVYNHFGPDGNYLKFFSADYFSDRYENEWGQAVNFDGPNSTAVREFVTTNAGYWIEEFHLDGLRLDAVQQIRDASPEHIVAALTRRVREAGAGKGTYVVAEDEPQDVRLVQSSDEGGFGLDAVWNDDFHHSAIVALTGRNEAYYRDYRGSPQELISAVKWGFLYQGQWYAWQANRRGTPTWGLSPTRFVNYLENHDQVANSMAGNRLHQLASPGRVRALTALLLLAPGTPMLFQGQEFAASSPFTYFTNHDPELARLVVKGRREFLQQFPSLAAPETEPYLPDPNALEVFRRCKLNPAERKHHASSYSLHRDLLKLRREDPVFSLQDFKSVDGAVLGGEAFVLRYFAQGGNDRLLLVNLGRDLQLTPAPEPLLAPPSEHVWERLWCSEAPQYGGQGMPTLDQTEKWTLTGQSAMVLQAVEEAKGKPKEAGG